MKQRDVSAILDVTREYWLHVSENDNNHQFSLIKTYLWIVVCFLTAHSYAYEHFNVFQELTAKVLYIVSVTSSVLAFLIGLISLSGLFFYKPLIGIVDSFLNVSDQYETENKNAVVKGLIVNYEESINGYLKMHTQRCYILRIMCILSIISFLSGLFCLIYLVN